MKSLLLLIAVVLLPVVFSENCPNPQDVPVMDERTNKYTGALVYQVKPLNPVKSLTTHSPIYVKNMETRYLKCNLS